METITTFEGFIWAVADLAIQVKYLAVKISIFFIMITAVYGVIKFYIGYEENGKLNFKKYVFTPIIMLLLLGNYSIMMDITSGVAGIIIRNTPGHNITGEDMILTMEKANASKGMDEVKHAYMETQVDNQSTWEWIQDVGTMVVKTASAPSRFITRAIWSGIQFTVVKLMRLIVEQTRNVVLGFLIIIGPFSLLFGILPIFRDVFKKWFRIYAAVLMWAVSINVIDAMIVNYYEKANEFQLAYIYEDSEGKSYLSETKLDEETVVGINSINGIEYMGMENGYINFTFAMMYMMVPLLTAFFMGEKLAGGFLSHMVDRTVGTVMSAGKMAAGAMTGGASAVAGKAGGATKSGLS